MGRGQKSKRCGAVNSGNEWTQEAVVEHVLNELALVLPEQGYSSEQVGVKKQNPRRLHLFDLTLKSLKGSGCVLEACRELGWAAESSYEGIKFQVNTKHLVTNGKKLKARQRTVSESSQGSRSSLVCSPEVVASGAVPGSSRSSGGKEIDFDKI